MSRYEELANEVLQEMLGALSQEMGRLCRGLLERPELQVDAQELLSRFGPLLGALLPRGLPAEAAYRLLGLDPSATDQEVRHRYRELAKRLHPDVAGGETEHLFRLVQAAYEQIARERGWKG